MNVPIMLSASRTIFKSDLGASLWRRPRVRTLSGDILGTRGNAHVRSPLSRVVLATRASAREHTRSVLGENRWDEQASGSDTLASSSARFGPESLSPSSPGFAIRSFRVVRGYGLKSQLVESPGY